MCLRLAVHFVILVAEFGSNQSSIGQIVIGLFRFLGSQLGDLAFAPLKSHFYSLFSAYFWSATWNILSGLLRFLNELHLVYLGYDMSSFDFTEFI